MIDDAMLWRHKLAIRVGDQLAACRVLAALARGMEDQPPASKAERMEFFQGLGFMLDELAESLGEVRAKLSED